MAEGEKKDHWLWIGVIVVSVAAIIFFAVKQFGFGAQATGGAYYSNDSIHGLLEISFAVCGSLALNPEAVQGAKMAYVQHMLTRHTADMQECLSYAEKVQNTGDPYWKSMYDQKIKAICIHTLDNIQVPRRRGAGAGGGGSTGNLIPAISDVFTDTGPSTVGTTIRPV